jgi:4-amino-4-deoxy-L-arabinose transferase-like glycosyltransferase
VNKIWKSFRIEISSHKLVYIFLFSILLFGFLLRIYRINSLLGFYYDQGRDALVIWDLITKGKTFLIGPTTGLAGIFRGPYYYYLISPFYFLGNGNPVWPSIFLSFTTVLAGLIGYYLGSKFQNKATGIIFAILSSFSFYIVTASRWLSNPTPMLLLSVVLIWSMYMVTQGKKWAWPMIFFVSGLSLFNFGSSGELFYFPAIIIFLIWQWKNRPNLKQLALSIILFTLTFVPLVVFDLKHEHILLNNILKTFGQEKSFVFPNSAFFIERTKIYYEIFSKELFHQRGLMELMMLSVVGASFLFFLPTISKNSKTRILLLLIASPIVGLYFYQGNYGNLYEYYLTGYYLIYLLLVAVVLGLLWKYRLGKVFVVLFIGLFLVNNYEPLKFTLTLNTDSKGAIYFANQKQAIDWIYKDANENKFNVDVYVPPVIPYTYDYLFTWYGNRNYGYEPDKNEQHLLYTLYEDDPPHPERLQAWLERQKGIGKILDSYTTGGITVEKRERITK